MAPFLLAFQNFTQFRHPQFQSLEVAPDAVLVEHPPGEDLHQPNAVRAKYEKGGIHDLSLGLVRLEELHRAVNRQGANGSMILCHLTDCRWLPSAGPE